MASGYTVCDVQLPKVEGDKLPCILRRGRGELMPEGLPELASQLEYLVKNVPAPPGYRRWTNELIAAQVSKQAGIEISMHHIAHLRAGRRNNPSAHLLMALASVFGVPVGFFADPREEARVRERLDAIAALNSPDVQVMAARGQVDVGTVIEVLRAMNALAREAEGGSS